MKTALLLIDIQNDYFPNGKMELRNPVEASEYANQLLQHFRTNSEPIFHIQHVAIKDDATFFLPNTEGVHIHESVRPLREETVIVKHYPNSFRETNLLEQLKRLNIEHVVVCGMMTICVDATVRAAFDFGFQCTVIHDACATKDLSFKNATIPAVYIHNTILASLNGVYANVISTQEFLAT